MPRKRRCKHRTINDFLFIVEDQDENVNNFLFTVEDQDENVSILEEAVAIRFVCRQREMEQEIRRAPAKDDVNIALLRDLQDEQDREIATVLEGILDLVWGMFIYVCIHEDYQGHDVMFLFVVNIFF